MKIINCHFWIWLLKANTSYLNVNDKSKLMEVSKDQRALERNLIVAWARNIGKFKDPFYVVERMGEWVR